MELNIDKLPIIKESLKKENVDVWMIVGRETEMNHEPALPVLGNIEFGVPTAFIFTQDKMIAVVGWLDQYLYQAIDEIDELVVYQDSLEHALQRVLKSLNPNVIALNYSMSDASSDGLTYGMRLMIDRILSDIDYQGEVVSAFPIVSRVRGIKTPTQIEKITFCAVKAHEYLMRVPEVLKEGSTSLDIFNFLQNVAYEDGYTMSWTPSQCPGVSVDPNVPSGHMGIIDTPIVKGYLINIDYGIAHDGYCSDLQRMYYVLKDDEVDAPEEAKRAFYAIRDAIEESSDIMKPGVTGYMVDRVARGKVVSEGYESWNAALGHQVGHQTHDGGTILANRRTRYNKPELIDTPLEAGNIFTIEPSCNAPQGRIGIEEMVVIENEGVRYLVPPQQELILVRLKGGN